MSTVLVFVDRTSPDEAHGDALPKSAQELLTLARAAGDPAVVLAGPLSDAVKEALGAHGVTRIYQSEQGELADYLVAPKADLLAQVARELSPAAVLVGNTPEGKEIAARAGIALSAGVVSDAVGLENGPDAGPGLLADKSVLAGSYLVKARATTATAIFTVKPNTVDPRRQPRPRLPRWRRLRSPLAPPASVPGSSNAPSSRPADGPT